MVGNIGQLAKSIRKLNKTIDGIRPEVQQMYKGFMTEWNTFSPEVKKMLGFFNSESGQEHIKSALEGVSSIKDLTKVAEELKPWIKYSFGAMAAMSVIGPVLGIIGNHAKSSSDEAFRDYMQRRLDVLGVVAIENMRMNAASFLEIRMQNLHLGVDYGEHEQRLSSMEQEAAEVIDFTPRLDIQKLTQASNEIYHALYKRSDDTYDPLDGITAELTTNQIKRVNFNQVSDLPPVQPAELNYATVKHVFGEVEVVRVMKAEVERLNQNGGENVFYQSGEHYDEDSKSFNRQEGFNTWMIAAHRFISDEDNGIANLEADHQYKDSQAMRAFVESFRNSPTRIQGVLSTDEYTCSLEVAQVIRNRAFMQFCRVNAAYTHGLRKIGSELGLGCHDAEKRYGKSITDGLKADATSIKESVTTKEGLIEAASFVWNQPLRFGQGMAARKFVIAEKGFRGTYGVAANKLLEKCGKEQKFNPDVSTHHKMR